MRPQPSEALILPTQVSKAHCQRQRQQNQNDFSSAAAARFFVIFQQVFKASCMRPGIRIGAQVRALSRSCIVQAEE
jgi:hypothetical protein